MMFLASNEEQKLSCCPHLQYYAANGTDGDLLARCASRNISNSLSLVPPFLSIFSVKRYVASIAALLRAEGVRVTKSRRCGAYE